MSDIDYLYPSGLPGEPLSGVDDIHTHPAEPRTIRAGIQLTCATCRLDGPIDGA